MLDLPQLGLGVQRAIFQVDEDTDPRDAESNPSYFGRTAITCCCLSAAPIATTTAAIVAGTHFTSLLRRALSRRGLLGDRTRKPWRCVRGSEGRRPFRVAGLGAKYLK